MEIAVPIAIEQHTQAQQPFRNRGAFLDHHLEQLMVVLHVAALQRIHEMRDGRVLWRDRNLHAPLSHHAVGVTETELRRQDDLGAGRMRMECRRTAGPPATNHQDIGRVIGRQIEFVRNRAVAFQQCRQLDNRLIPFVGTKADRPIGSLTEIRMIFVDQLVTICRREFGKGLLASSIPRLMHDLLKGVDVHDCAFSSQRSVFRPMFRSRELTATLHATSRLRSDRPVLFRSS